MDYVSESVLPTRRSQTVGMSGRIAVPKGRVYLGGMPQPPSRYVTGDAGSKRRDNSERLSTIGTSGSTCIEAPDGAALSSRLLAGPLDAPHAHAVRGWVPQ